MSKAWLTIPSARPLDELEPVLEKWKLMGYGIALVRQGEPTKLAELLIPTQKYLGWAASINLLAGVVLTVDPDCDWCVGGGDDTFPDPSKTADDIAAECSEYFESFQDFGGCRTFGVMQPVGDSKNWPNSQIKNFAGSPWLGREWCGRAYQGKGPLFPYHHSWADEELQNVATKYCVFWQRPDLTQPHMHHTRPGGMPRPSFANMIDQDYKLQEGLFRERKAANWPGSEPLTNG